MREKSEIIFIEEKINLKIFLIEILFNIRFPIEIPNFRIYTLGNRFSMILSNSMSKTNLQICKLEILNILFLILNSSTIILKIYVRF